MTKFLGGPLLGSDLGQQLLGFAGQVDQVAKILFQGVDPPALHVGDFLIADIGLPKGLGEIAPVTHIPILISLLEV